MREPPVNETLQVARQRDLSHHLDDPFDLRNERAYGAWRGEKLARYPASLSDLVVRVRDPRALSPEERQALAERCARANMVIYASPDTTPDKDLPRLLARQFGVTRLDHNWLADDDGISSVTVTGEAGRGDYIPYTNRAIRWHTDGYYNPPDRRIRAMILHCVSSAASGGENRAARSRDRLPAAARRRSGLRRGAHAARCDDHPGAHRRRRRRPRRPRRARCSPLTRTAALCTCATRPAPAASNGRTTRRARSGGMPRGLLAGAFALTSIA